MLERIRNRSRCAALTWLIAYPLMTTLVFLLEPAIEVWPLPLRTLLLTSVMVPTMVLWLVPVVSARTAALFIVDRRSRSVHPIGDN